MTRIRNLIPLALSGCVIALAGCSTGSAPPPSAPLARPSAFIPLGLSASYLASGAIGGQAARAAKLRAAKIRPLSPTAAYDYLDRAERDLRSQTVGIGVDVIRVGNSLLIRIPATLTFDSNSAAIKPQFEATLSEVARTLKAYNQSMVDVLAHTDSTGSPEHNLTLSQKRASSVAAFLAAHGVSKARIATKGMGEAAPLYSPDDTETERAGNRRVEIRLIPYRAS
jgi:outer membrane protein OmpA-like peptidoglycan-associated protein